jgi:glyoxylase-like metal-dependent hydrolase (beta-lactamase superfamily II)
MKAWGLLGALFTMLAGMQPALAQTPQGAAFETRKITDHVYLFRYGGHQSIFVVTRDGVIATDPIAFLRPAAATTYIEEIRKVSSAPIKYLIYSHHHYDHVAGGKPFKDAGATIVAHKNAKTRLEQLRFPDVVMPDETVDDYRAIELGGVRVELYYVGRNHSDNSLVMLLPKERILFTVDFVPIQTLPFRDFADGFVPDWFDSLDRVLSLDWEQMIPGHPYAGGRFGTKEDVRALKQYMLDLSEEVRNAAYRGECFDQAIKQIRLPKYEKWGNYATFLPMNVQRFCEYWGRGY